MTRRPPRPFFAVARPLSFAHRGGSALWPENTLLAFRQGLGAGCDVIETDLRLTRDGELVVFHDERLERTTNGHGLVHEHSLAELKRLDAGYHFSPDGLRHPHRSRGLVVPTLREVVDLAPELRLNVELKRRQPGIVEALWRLIEQHDMHQRILVAASDDALVQRFREVSHGQVATAAGFGEVTRFWLAARLRLSRLLSPPFDALQVPQRHGRFTVVDHRLVSAAHARAIHVHVWTVDQPEQMRRLLELGVDGLMSDRPDRLVPVVREYATSAPLPAEPRRCARGTDQHRTTEKH